MRPSYVSRYGSSRKRRMAASVAEPGKSMRRPSPRKDVNDDGEPARFPRAAQQALATDVRHG